MTKQLKTWLDSWRLRRPVRRRPVNATRFRSLPLLKVLEDRVAPAVFTVNTLADSGPESLRQAILDANAHVNNASDPTDLITFTVAGTVTVASPLPALSDSSGGTVIDGRTAPGYAGAPVVVLRGPGATSNVTGLSITSARNTLWALQVDSFTTGVELSGAGATGNVIAGNYVGTNGTAAVGNATGIAVTGASNNRIGSDGDGIDDAAERNVISGNTSGTGVRLSGAAQGNVVAGNFIGTNAAGDAALGNGTGVVVQTSGPAPNTIGGTTPALRNVISGNSTGVNLFGAQGALVQGNFIGTNAAGNAALGNGTGVSLQLGSFGNVIGGTTAGARNVISGNSTGVGFTHGNTQNNVVQGNYIGTDVTGSVAIGNTFRGVDFNLSTNNTIGGSAAGAGNVISGNATGVFINANGNAVVGNRIGTRANGTGALGNAGHGVHIFLASGNSVIGNTVAFNGGNGVLVLTFASFSAVNNLIRANAIFSNAGLGINLQGDAESLNNQPTANDAGDADAGPNNQQNFPVLGLVNSGPSGTVVTGTLNSRPNTTFTLEFFATPTGDASGFGEGATPLGTLAVTTDASGNVSFTAEFATVVPVGQVITATATDPNNNTSEFSAWVPVRPDPTASVSNATVTEGDEGTAGAMFTVSLSGPSGRAVTVNYATADGTATADSDYQAASGTLTFAPGETTKTVTVTVNGDTTDEPDETFFVNLSSPTNAMLGRSQGVGTIVDNDSPPTVSVNDARVTEGDSGFVSVVFTVSLSQASGKQVQVSFATADGTAAAPGDYSTTTGTLTFTPGQTVGTVSVSVQGDVLNEGTETFTVNLTDAVNATVDRGQGVGTIVDDDNPLVARDDTATTNEDTPVTVDVLANDTDPDGDTLTVTGVTPAAHGTAVVNADGTVTYTPAANYNGEDAFTYTISDGRGFSATATVTLTVRPVNDPPAADADAAATDEDTAATVAALANDTDVDGDALAVTGFTQGAHGAVALNADGTLTYTPAADFNGSDSFTYTISDGHGGSATATVSITVRPVNDLPVANGDTAATDEDAAVTVPVLANDSDVDGDTLTVTSVTQGAHGAVALNADGTLTYTPAANFNGTDTFTYTISDGHGGTATATVTVTVNPVNDPPAANADAAATDEDTAATVNVLANDADVDGDTLTVTSVTQGAHGAVALNADGTLTYTPAANFNGTDTFTYTVSDGHGGTATAAVTVTVRPVNDPPVANPDTAATDNTVPVTIAVLANDSDLDGDALTVTGVTQGAHGTVTVNPNGTLTYTPAANFGGTDTFAYTVSDGHGGTATAAVTVTVTAVNRPPDITSDDLTLSAAVINEGGSVSVGGTFRDPDAAQAHTVVIHWGDGSTDTLTLNPGVTLFGPVSHTYRDDDPSQTPSDQYAVVVTVTDSHGVGAAAAKVVRVNNVAPTVQLGPDRSAREGTAVTLSGGVSDPGTDTFTYRWRVVSNNGQVIAEGTSADFGFTPQDNGVYTVTLTVTDDDGGVGQDEVVVTGTNAAPVAGVTGPAAGVRGQALAFTFTAADPSPVDQAAGFLFTVTWGDGSTQTVNGPSLQGLSHTYTAGGQYSVRVTATDKDGGVSDVASKGVSVTAVGLQQDPYDPTKLALVVGGTTTNDCMSFRPGDSPGQVVVSVYNWSGESVVGVFSPTAGGAQLVVKVNGVTVSTTTVAGPATLGRVIGYGQAGNDQIELDDDWSSGHRVSFSVSAFLFGGDGNDDLDARGSIANNVLRGGAGQDDLEGGSGRDLLIGGLGSDELDGEGGEDILIGGTTDYDNNLVALGAILAEWGRTDLSFDARVNHLRGQPGGLNGPYVLTDLTVHKDGYSDDLDGGDGQDWFFN